MLGSKGSAVPVSCPVSQVHRDRDQAVPELRDRLQDPRPRPAGPRPCRGRGLGRRPFPGLGQRRGGGREGQRWEVGLCPLAPAPTRAGVRAVTVDVALEQVSEGQCSRTCRAVWGILVTFAKIIIDSALGKCLMWKHGVSRKMPL